MSSESMLDRFKRLQAELTTLVSEGKRDPEMVCRALERLVAEPRLKVWRQVVIGQVRSGSYYHRILERQGAELPAGTGVAMAQVPVASIPARLNLVALTVEELGLSGGVSLERILDAGRELGLHLCPAEIGPALRLQYWEQPREWLTIAMEPLKGRDGTAIVFRVGRVKDKRWLRVFANPPNGWSAQNRFVFVKPTQ